jgi:glycosyltransferase involved in cell wall biosynthesis
MAPIVSVVVTFLDAEEFLEAAIESVVAQTLTSWELILVDDGSSDGSSAIARGRAESDPARIRYIDHDQHRNCGKSVSRNAGLAASRGLYVFFLDGDDVLRPNAIEELSQLLDAHPNAAVAYGPLQWWFSWSGMPGDATRDFIEPFAAPLLCVVPPPHLLARYLAGRVPVPSGILVRRDAALAVGGFADEFRELYEDQVFLVRLLLRNGAIVTAQSVYCYRRHGGASTAESRPHEVFDIARSRFHAWTARYFRTMRVYDLRLWAALGLARLSSAAPRLYYAARSFKRALLPRSSRQG